ncbi:PE domain-containing protein [Amycolatopsis anabasis]|uniref:PE domain-containing protein n=1 Tax=Amycolatopsis anabasis TaxID=1840409 RepID=UPI00131DF5BC|nr:PE domain-containing protein [Amycolatopsis anabasis]
MPDGSNTSWNPADVTRMPSAPPPGAPPLPLPATGPVTVTQGTPPPPPPQGYIPPATVCYAPGHEPPPPPPLTGGYKMDVDEMRAILPQWEALRDKLQTLNTKTQAGAQMNLAPADDDASTRQADAALAHAQVYRQSLAQQFEYAARYAETLKAMIDATEKQNAAARDGIRKAGQGA